MTLGDLTRREAIRLFLKGAAVSSVMRIQSSLAQNSGYDIVVDKKTVISHMPCGQVRNVSWTQDGRLLVTAAGVWLADPDGKNYEPILKNDFSIDNAVMSPDRNRIAFSSNRQDGVDEIYTMGANGKDIERVTYLGGSAFKPVWLDGKRLLFGYVKDKHYLYTLNVEDKLFEVLTATEGTMYNHALSPDGKDIAYDDGRDIYLINVRGGDFRIVARSVGPLIGDPYIRYHQPAWSPDSQNIVCTVTGGFDTKHDNLVVMDRDGSNKNQITEKGYVEVPRVLDGAPEKQPINHRNAAWSSDGSMIACIQGFYSRDKELEVLHVRKYQRAWLCH